MFRPVFISVVTVFVTFSASSYAMCVDALTLPGVQAYQNYLMQKFPNLPRVREAISVFSAQELIGTGPYYRTMRWYEERAQSEITAKPRRLKENTDKLIWALSENRLLGAAPSLVDTLLQSILARDHSVQEQITSVPQEMMEIYHANWAARNTGPIISTRPRDLVELGKYLSRQGPIKRFVDVGSGHGLPALILSRSHAETEFIGFDLVEAKVQTAQDLADIMKLSKVRFKQQNLMAPDFTLPVADIYYFYNPANEEVIERMASQIKEIAKRSPVRVISYGSGWVVSTFLRYGFRVREEVGRFMVLEI